MNKKIDSGEVHQKASTALDDFIKKTITNAVEKKSPVEVKPEVEEIQADFIKSDDFNKFAGLISKSFEEVNKNIANLTKSITVTPVVEEVVNPKVEEDPTKKPIEKSTSIDEDSIVEKLFDKISKSQNQPTKKSIMVDSAGNLTDDSTKVEKSYDIGDMSSAEFKALPEATRKSITSNYWKNSLTKK